MKPEDVEFVRNQWGIAKLSKDALYEVPIRHYCKTIGRLLSLLAESEAMREKAEHKAYKPHACLDYQAKWVVRCEHEEWSDADWQKSVKQKLEIE